MIMATLNAVIAGFVAAREYDGATLSRLQFWSDHLGEKELAAISPEEVDNALVALATRGRLRPRAGKKTEPSGKPLAPATIDRYVSQLAAVFKFARRLRMLPRAHVPPTRGVESGGSPLDPDRYLRPEEIERLLDVATLVDSSWGRMRALITLAFHTGLRKGNLLELRWRDVDLSARTLSVLRTKNGQPIVQPLSERAAAELEALPGRPHPDAFVFEGRGGRPFHIRRLWSAVCREAGLPGRNFHQLRHSCGHALATAGVGQAQIMAVMGHRTLTASARYMHSNVADKRDVVDRVFS